MTIAAEGGHWYRLDGTPCYEIKRSDGTMRPTNLRDARKLDLVPSVSGIMKMAAADPLTRWKIRQHLLTSAAMPRQGGEDTESYIARILAETRQRLSEAPDTGTAIHACIEKDLCGQTYDPNFQPHVDGALRKLADWCGGLDGIESEKSFAHILGYGGKVDIHKKLETGFVADFKSKDFDEDSLPDVWDNHAWQLSAYRKGFNMPDARCAIIFVSTKVPGLTHLVEIAQDELERGWEMFKLLLRFWQLKNRYIPAKGN